MTSTILAGYPKHHGVKAAGLCRIVNLKDRVKGLGDVEILIDGDWWELASESSTPK